MSRGFVIALLGAESTGKTTLAQQIVDALNAEGHDAALVGEYLREFCVLHERTPRIDEQRSIAEEQTHRIEAAASTHRIVVADTSALMVAVYSDMLFLDKSLYADAALAHARCDLTLLTALDLPWIADGLQREGPHVRELVDRLLRAALHAAQLPYAVIAGSGERRVAAAMQAVRHALRAPSASDESAANPRWQWVCERCGDANCERHLLPRTPP
jgi:nicotinamide riboside kinase